MLAGDSWNRALHGFLNNPKTIGLILLAVVSFTGLCSTLYIQWTGSSRWRSGREMTPQEARVTSLMPLGICAMALSLALYMLFG